MKNLSKALALILFSLPLLASAAGKTASATMQVTFEVKESCNVQTSGATASAANGASAKVATVSCELHSPYLMDVHHGDKAATVSSSAEAERDAVRQDSNAERLTVYF